jgi:hypothetical protein
MRQHSITGMGGRPRWRSVASRVLSGEMFAGTSWKAPCRGRSVLRGGGRTMRDPELVARAQRAAKRLETAWEQWRALHGLAVAPGQPVVSYVGYSLTEPWGEPRVVIGIDADEAEFLADFLDRDECARRGQVPQQVPFQPRLVQSGPRQPAPLPEQSQESRGEYPSSSPLGAPVTYGSGRPSPDHARDLAAELAGWSPAELPGQSPDQRGGWPTGAPRTYRQPPATA